MAPLNLLTSVLLSFLLLATQSSTQVPPIISGEPPPLIADDVVDVTNYSLPANNTLNSSQITEVAYGAKLLRRITQSDYLRILPLGASITQGVDSTTGNGYRKPLRDQLRSQGWLVNMVGSKADGTMVNNENDGYPGYIISQVQGIAENAIAANFKPNIVLLNAGTNDCLQSVDTGNAAKRLLSLIQTCLNGMPNVSIITSTLIVNADPTDNACVTSVNVDIRAMVANLNNPAVILADMNDGFITQSDLSTVDGIHPNDFGYEKMAAVWWNAFQDPDFQAQISPPQNNGIPDGTAHPSHVCPKTLGFSDGGAAGTGHQTQAGSGYDDGPYVHTPKSIGSVAIGNTLGLYPYTKGVADFSGIFFAQIINAGGAPRGGELDELIIVTAVPIPKSIDVFNYTYLLNLGGNPPQFGAAKAFNPGFSCTPSEIHWADINNDGLDDFLCVDTSGNVRASKNNGDGTFTYLRTIMSAPPGTDGTLVRFGDMDGDGRADYCIVSPTLHCWRNGGVGDAPAYWQEMSGFNTYILGPQVDTEPIVTKDFVTGIMLRDLNGDYRAERLYMDVQGGINTLINNRGIGPGLTPDWQNMGKTHGGMGVNGARTNIRFGRLFGTGRPDYIWLNSCTALNGEQYICMSVFRNEDTGGMHLKGDGVMYCDMRGTGSDDYVWVSPDGQGYFFGNQHIWDPSEWIQGSTNLFGSHIYDRRGIRLADIDGDGKCDLVLLNQNDGTMTWMQNSYNTATGAFTFTAMGAISGPFCAYGWGGVGLRDLAVRFADINGDKRPDYLCMQPNGQTVGFLNMGIHNWSNVGQVKKSEGWDRANIQFADANGDGRADFHWANKFTGDVTVFYNEGETPNSGSSFTWNNAGEVWRGSAFNDRGTNFHFPNLNGLGRADMHDVNPRVNSARTWFNICPGSTTGGEGDDPDCCADPGLPVYIPSTTNETDVGDPSSGFSLPSDTFLPAFEGPIYGLGDALLFDTPVPSEINLNLIVIGGETQWADMDCGSVSAADADGDTLGCVALGVSWLIYSVYLLDGGTGSSTPARSLPSSKYHFQVHSDWEHVGNCTTSCMLLDHTPQHAWTPVGNGTYNGIYHELHFMHTDKFTAHRASPGRATLTPRTWVSFGGQMQDVNLHGQSYHTYLYNLRNQRLAIPEIVDDYASQLPGDSSAQEAAPDWIGGSVEEAVALSNNTGFCVTLISGGTVVSTSLMGMTQSASEWADSDWGSDWRSAGDIETTIAQCAADNADGNHIGSAVFVCGQNLTLIDPSLEDDPDGNSGGDDLLTGALYKRTGAEQSYTIRNMAEVGANINPVSTVIWTSSPYPNGGNGQNLQAAGGDDHVYDLGNAGPCTDATVRDDAPIDGPNAIRVDAEHLMERNTIPTALEYAQTLTMNLADGNGDIQAAGLTTIPFNIITDYMAIPYREWPNIDPETARDLPAYESLFYDLAEALGSVDNPEPLTNLEHGQNLVKTRIWRSSFDVTADNVWNDLLPPTAANTAAALNLIRSGIFIFNYLNSPGPQGLLNIIHDAIKEASEMFDILFNLYEQPNIPGQASTNLQGIWVNFINQYTSRMANYHRNYANARLDQLIAGWNNLLAQNPTQQQQQIANEAIKEINNLKSQVAALLFDRANFV